MQPFKLLIACLFFFGILHQVHSAIIWNGNFNAYQTSSDLDQWSFSNEGVLILLSHSLFYTIGLFINSYYYRLGHIEHIFMELERK